MTCATPEQLAARQIDAAHLGECLACRRALDDQRAVATQLAALAAPVLDANRRRTLAAEVMARADLHDDTRELAANRWGRRSAKIAARGDVRNTREPAANRWRTPGAIIVSAIAFAAAALVVVGRDERALSTRIEPTGSPVVVEPRAAATTPAPPVPAPRAPMPAHDAPEEATVAPAPEPPPPIVGRARQVFGATTSDRAQPIDRSTLLEETPIAAFRAGWEALRAQRYAEAIAAFDRATDPAVAEDAVFWAAIAAQRARQTADARKRLDAFLATFPASPRAESARRAREVLR